MALVISQADAKKGKTKKGGCPKVCFFDFPDAPDMPHASLNGHLGDTIDNAHFHVRDQCQIVVDGEFRLGRHELSPYCLHFSRAYTPYGPLAPKHGGEYAFIVMRTRRDSGAQYVAREMDQLRAVPGRMPWQVSSRIDFPAQQSRSELGKAALQALPEVRDDHGLAAYALSLEPDAKTSAPDPAHGDGQYLVVVRGSLWHDNREHRSYTLVFSKPDEGPFQVQAGAEGLDAIIVNFPQVTQRPGRAKASPAAVPASGLRKWRCELCAFTYDEAHGMPAEGISAGTRWDDVPDTWNCPDCAANKCDFQMVEMAEV